MTEENDIHIESEEAPESQAYEKLIGKIEGLKEELKQCNKERQEYLDGWQRMRADVANSKRERGVFLERTEAAIREEVVADIIPILDSFDMAMGVETWRTVDEGWRKGVEQIRAQCARILQKHGISAFGEMGEQFNPEMHETVGEVGGAKETSYTIARVIRLGYKMENKVIRPAHVEIAT